MPVKPNEVPLMNEERQRVLDEAIIKVDQEILSNGGRDPHHIYLGELGKTSGTYIDWFYEELVRQYKVAGWKYVTVYKYTDSDWRTLRPSLHLSTKTRLTTTKSRSYPYSVMQKYLFGDKIV
ncbi:MAG: hypothetical protein V4606_03025 [Patescibacteria group bacterium]